MRAAELARQHGVFRTAKVLRLDFSKLKRQMGPAQAQAKAVSSPPPAFVEFSPSANDSCVRMCHRGRRTARPHAHRVERQHLAGSVRIEPGSVGAGRLIQIAPQIRILVAVEPIDARKGIDSLAQLCREKLSADPFSGWPFIFRSRRGTR